MDKIISPCVEYNVCVFVSLVVMCVNVMNEPTPRNSPCTCYLVNIKLCLILMSYVVSAVT